MAEAKTYLQGELEQKEAKRISSFLFRSVIDSEEKILAIFGYTGMLGNCACLISTRDLLVYFNNFSMLPHEAAILYSDLTGAAVKSEGKDPVICLTTRDGKTILINIKAPLEEMQKMAAFIEGYQAAGAAYVAQQTQNISDYSWKIDAIHQRKNLKNAEIDWNAMQKITVNKNKMGAERVAIKERYDEKINQAAASRSISRYTLDYCSGLPRLAPAPAKITVNSPEQMLEIAPQGEPGVRIPFADIRGSHVTTETGIPPDDLKNKYTYLLHIACVCNGSDTEIVLSHRQKQNATVDPIAQMNYIIEHIGEKIAEYQVRNAQYDQRAQELAAERERLLTQRAGQMAEIRNLFSGGQTSRPAAAAPADDPIEAIKKYKELLDQGILTQEEFDIKKKQLLGL